MKKTTKENIIKLKLDCKIAIKDKKRWLFCLLELLIIAVLIVFDMLTKKYIYGYCDANKDIIIFKDVLRFTATINTGAGFGMMKGKTTLLTVISFISALILIALVFYSYPRRNKWLRSSLVLIIAGAVGNLIDRMFLGYVRDFVYFELINFAVFNFADSFLTIGTILLIIYVLFFYSKDEEEIDKKRKLNLAIAQAETEKNIVDNIANTEENIADNIANTENKKDGILENKEPIENTKIEEDK